MVILNHNRRATYLNWGLNEGTYKNEKSVGRCFIFLNIVLQLKPKMIFDKVMNLEGNFLDLLSSWNIATYCIDKLNDHPNPTYLECSLKTVSFKCHADKIEFTVENCFGGDITPTNPKTGAVCQPEMKNDCGEMTFTLDSESDW